MSVLWLLIGFFLLSKGADVLVRGATDLARGTGVSDLTIGLTVVAFGTSLPELMVSGIASVQHASGITLGNVLGSNTFNILVILGISALMYPLSVPAGTVWKEIPFSVLAAVMVGLLAPDRFPAIRMQQLILSRRDGYILLGFFALFLYYVGTLIRTAPAAAPAAGEIRVPLRHTMFRIVVGLTALCGGGKLVVLGAAAIARAWGVSEALIGLTIIAAGTSLPELAASVAAAMKKNPELAVGNVVGSNVFNIFFILGLSAVIRPIPVPVSLLTDIGVVIAASLVLFLFMFTGKRRTIDRWEAVVLIAGYIGYTVFIVYRG